MLEPLPDYEVVVHDTAWSFRHAYDEAAKALSYGEPYIFAARHPDDTPHFYSAGVKHVLRKTRRDMRHWRMPPLKRRQSERHSGD